MVKKLGTLLWCMFLFAILGIEPAQNLAKYKRWLCVLIQSQRGMVMNLGKHQRSKDTNIYVVRSITMQNVLFCVHTLHELRNQNVSIG